MYAQCFTESQVFMNSLQLRSMKQNGVIKFIGWSFIIHVYTMWLYNICMLCFMKPSACTTWSLLQDQFTTDNDTLQAPTDDGSLTEPIWWHSCSANLVICWYSAAPTSHLVKWHSYSANPLCWQLLQCQGCPKLLQHDDQVPETIPAD